MNEILWIWLGPSIFLGLLGLINLMWGGQDTLRFWKWGVILTVWPLLPVIFAIRRSECLQWIVEWFEDS